MLMKHVTRLFKNNKLLCAGIILSVLLSLTPVYGLGYVILVSVVARDLNVIKAFDSVCSNFVLSSLLLACSIMVTGMFTSYLNIHNYATINVFFALFFFGAILYLQPRVNIRAKKKRFTLSDIIAIVTGFSIPLLIVAIHLSTLGINGALFKIANADGWDSTSHLNFLQVTSKNKNYFYPTSPVELGDKTLHNSYPQGWHLASSNIADGLLPGALDPSSYGLSTTLITYLLIVFAWYFAACFVLVKAVWSLLKRSSGRAMRSVLVFTIVQIPILLLYLSYLNSGYMNYIGLIPLVLLVCLISYEALKMSSKTVHIKPILLYTVISVLLTAGVCLTWPLPTPALALLVIFTIAATGFSISSTGIRIKLLIMAATAFCVAAMALYGALLVQDIGADKLEIAPLSKLNSQLVASTGLALGLLVALEYRKNKTAFLVLLPFLVTVLMFWLYAYSQEAGLGYYHAKLLSLVFALVLTFSSGTLVNLVESFSVDGMQRGGANFAKMLFSLGIVTLMVLIYNKPIDTRLLHPSGSTFSKVELNYITGWMYSSDALNNKEQLLVARSSIRDNPNGTMLFNHLSTDGAINFLTGSQKSEYTCLQYMYWDKRGRKLNRLDTHDSLSTCIHSRMQAGLKTVIFLPKSAKLRYQKTNTYDAEIIYH